MRLLWLFGWMMMLGTTGHAQWHSPSLEVGTMAGNILNIYPNIPPTSTQVGGYLMTRWSHDGPYNALYNEPRHSLALSYHDLGNPSLLGTGIGLQYQIRFEKNLFAHWSLINGLQIGGLYVTKPYHFIDNTANNVFGSPFSALITATSGIQFKFEQNAITTQVSYWHSSNAHTALPNVGMNTPMLMLGYERSFFSPVATQADTSASSLKLPNQWGVTLFGAWGRNEAGGTTRPTNGAKYNKQVLSIGASYRFRTIHRLLLSVDAYHDNAYALWNETMQWSADRPFIGASALMVMIGHEFIYGHFGLIVQGGYNLYNPTLKRLVEEVESPSTSNKLKAQIPGRFAVRYYINKDEKSDLNLFIQAAVKSNMGQADFMEIGIGSIISGRQVKGE